MTDEQRLAEIRARADAAMPGPWHPSGVIQVSARATGRPSNLGPPAEPIDAANAAFVAAARDDLPWLLDLVQQQAGVIADLAEESDAARLALRYREALEWIADLNIHKEGLKPAQFRTYALDAEKMQHVAREALEGKS